MKILILLLFLALPAFAFSIHVENIETVTTDGARLKGVRWVNEGGQRILLIHGFSENTNVFNDIAKELNELGYDVYAFNLRGHGNDNQRSKVRGYSSHIETKNGIYSFDQVVSRDVPAMIDFVYDGSPIVVLGHSLGGSAARYFLNGVRDYGDGLHQTSDSRKLNKYLSKVKNLINVGSPTSFQKSDFRFKIWKKLPESLTNLMLTPLMRRYLGEYVFSGLVETDNIEDKEKLFSEGFSVISPDFIQDVQRWGHGKYESRNGTAYEGQKISPDLNFFQVLGSADQLVTLKEILSEQDKFEITKKSQIVVLKNFGHIDLIYGQKSSNLLAPIVSEVIENESLKGVKSTDKVKVIEAKPRSCSSLF